MTGEAQAGIPPPLDNDDDDVAWALQTAAAQWKLAAFADVPDGVLAPGGHGPHLEASCWS